MKYLAEDIELIQDDQIFEKDITGTYLITGATGFIGSYCVNLIMKMINQCNRKCKVIASVRNIRKGEEEFKEYLNSSNFSLIENDIRKEFIINEDIDYIIHATGSTHKGEFDIKPVDTIETIYMGTHNILELARKKKVKKVLVTSTAQIYGNTIGDYITEDKVSGFDTMTYKNCYSESKRMSETLCSSYFKQYGVKVNVVRLFHVYGPGTSLELGTFFSEFFSRVLEEEDIILQSAGAEVRNLCYITDVVRGIFYTLFDGEAGEAYNIGSDTENITIRDFAYLLAQIYKKKNISVIEKNNQQVYNNIINQKPLMKKLHKLGWKSEISLVKGLNEMFRYYDDINMRRGK